MLARMITKQRYVEYLICTPINYTCFNLSEHLDGVSHDVVSNFLKQSRMTSRHLWELVKGLIQYRGRVPDYRRQRTRQALFKVDRIDQDAVQRCGRRLVRGIGVVNLVHSDGQEHYPVDTGFIIMQPTARPRTTILRTCSSTPLPTKCSRRRRCCSTVGTLLGKT